MKRLLSVLLVIMFATSSIAQGIQRPKLVVGIVVDQMRWDYLYRYYDRYAPDGGFKRFLNQGFSCENTFIPYTPTVTAAGHTCIYTGSVPAIHGIVGNEWWDKEKGAAVYCAEDALANSVGSNDAAGKMSPRNMLTSTIGDELKLATNFRSKVIGIAIKDRGAILPAGHAADAAYWYDSKTGDWISSTYYMEELPQWVKNFNAKKLVDKYYQQGWNTLYPIDTYVQSTPDANRYEGKPFGTNTFPYDLKKYVGKNYGLLPVLPYGNTLTEEMAKAAIINEGLGKDDITDLLTISFSTPDYIGHTFGPNSIEQEDDFLRLDKDLGDLFDFLDTKVGKDQYLVFLSADHGVAHVPTFAADHKLPAGSFFDRPMIENLNLYLKQMFGQEKLVDGSYNYQLLLNHALIDSLHLNEAQIKDAVVDYAASQPGIARAFALDKLAGTTLNKTQKERITNGYFPKRSGDVQLILDPQWVESYGATGTSHGLWNPYDSHIPLLWYGWHIKPGSSTNRETYMTDIAATIAAMLHIQMPNGCVGNVIPEIMK
jgi:predicted AlkP superfamily pyrophosphatase or phosphodiesterase